MQDIYKLKIAFFGTPDMAVTILNQLKDTNILPTVVITKEDMPTGRGLRLAPTPVKKWAEENNIDILCPHTISMEFIENFKKLNIDIAIVAGYGKILPIRLLEIPKFDFINVHPSLLPKYRGSTPVQSALLNKEKVTGVTIIKLDDKMDHGPILSQEEYNIPNDMRADELLTNLSRIGGALIPKILEDMLNSELKEIVQTETDATYCNKIIKQDGEIKINDDPNEIYAKFRAYTPWPGIYFFQEKNGKNTRVIITDMKLDGDFITILKVKPEGKNEISYEDFKK
jgi:methionyl-tRNA formyltransferase